MAHTCYWKFSPGRDLEFIKTKQNKTKQNKRAKNDTIIWALGNKKRQRPWEKASGGTELSPKVIVLDMVEVETSHRYQREDEG